MAKANAAIENNHEQSMLEQPRELTALHQQHLLQTLAANIPGTAVFVVDANLRYRLADGPALRDAAMTSADFEGKTIFEALDPDLARAYEPNYRQALAGQSFQLEHHSHDRDYITQGTPLRNAAGEVYAAMAVSHDITDHKRTERNLTFLAEISEEVVSLSNPEAIMARVGERIAGYLGLSRCNFSIVELEADRITAIYDWRRDASAPSVVGEHRISTFLTEQGNRHYATGQMAVVNDSRHHPMMNATPDMLRMLHIGSVVDAPYLQQGQWKFLLSACRFEPCVWRDDEVALIRELAARIYLRIERARAEVALIESRAMLAHDLEDTKKLQAISSLLIEEESDEGLYEHILDAAMAIMHADFSSMQILDAERGKLNLIAWRNFHPDSAGFWQSLDLEAGTTCGSALRYGGRIIVPDVSDAGFKPDPESMRHYRLSGIAAIQSTPLTTREGRVVGMISTHWREPHAPDERELRLLDILARQAADFIERRRALEALRESETKYRALFEEIDEGYCIIQMLYDNTGKAIDWRFLQVNRAFEMNNGLSQAAGKTIRELTPNIEPKWMDIYDHVAQTGTPLRFEEDSLALGRIFNLYAHRIGDPQERKVAVIFSDITERKLAEATLHQSEARKDFLLHLSDALRPITDAVEVQATVTRATMEYFGTDRCYYCEVENGNAIIRQDASREGLASVAGVYPIDDMPIFKSVLDAGKRFVVQDATLSNMLDESLRQLCIQLKVISFIDVPVMRAGKTVGILCITQCNPRQWTNVEMEMAEEVAERAWLAVERARAEAALKTLNEQLEQRVFERTEALRQSHEQLRELSAHMEMTREDERTRIAREVHDELGGHLTALKIDLGALTWGRDADAVLVERVNDLKAHIDEIVTIVRRIGSDLRPPVLDDYGLIPALEWHGREFERRTGIPCFLDLMDNKPPLNREKRTAVFRVFQEALTNVARHADATKVNVTMGVDDGHLVLVIEDDGIGLQMDELDFNHSLGLKGMQERMNEVGGVVEIDSEAGRGVVVDIRVPV